MSKKWSPKAIWLGLGAAAAMTVAGGYTLVHSAFSGNGSGKTDKSILTGRIWIDHAPKKDTEYFELFVILDQSPAGVFEKGSSFEGQFEIFRYEPRGDGKLQLLFPQRAKKFDVKYDAKECREGQFDYCLSITGAPRGAPKYMSRKGWEIEGGSVAEIEQKIEAWKTGLELEHDDSASE